METSTPRTAIWVGSVATIDVTPVTSDPSREAVKNRGFVRKLRGADMWATLPHFHAFRNPPQRS